MKKLIIGTILMIYMAIIPMTAFAAEITFDLETLNANGGDVSINNNIITIDSDPDDIIIIKGNNPDDYSIEIENALDIRLEENTEIYGTGEYHALIVPDGSTITGMGDGIVIAHGDGSSSDGYSGIFSTGDISISGTIKSIEGSNSDTGSGGSGISAKNVIISDTATIFFVAGGNSYEDFSGSGISAEDNINISGTIQTIRAGEANQLDGSGGYGLFSQNGKIIISGNIKNIYGGDADNSGGHGIFAFAGDIIIEQDAIIGNIFGGNSALSKGGDGIHASGKVIILGTTEDIIAGSSYEVNGGTGIFSYNGNIEISGNIKDIYGGDGYELGGHGIFAPRT